MLTTNAINVFFTMNAFPDFIKDSKIVMKESMN